MPFRLPNDLTFALGKQFWPCDEICILDFSNGDVDRDELDSTGKKRHHVRLTFCKYIFLAAIPWTFQRRMSDLQ